MNVKLTPEKCIACGLCQTISTVFDYDDDGIVIFSESTELEIDVPLTPAIMEAAKSCPTRAIEVERDYFK
ncbi:ferredoxin [Streptococcus sp. DD13]|uniref:ferredoxin n=1 Tax=Streptococcus sp. DD13 TaxID=1777881 RepID=UPI00079C3EEC|nr:ferredoxin [Streptococcus sp. DD13]KXT79160.1 Ferredoxin [Streptococcus sp. DD13]